MAKTRHDVKPWKDEETLEWAYHEKRLTTYEAASLLGVTQTTIRYWMDEHGIERTRTPNQGGPWRDREKLKEYYHNSQFTLDEVAAELGCSLGTVMKWVKKHDLTRREEIGARSDPNEGEPWRDQERLEKLYYDDGLSVPEIADQLNCGLATISKWLSEFDIDVRTNSLEIDEELLYELYHEEELSQKEIANRLGCHVASVQNWMSSHGIPTRSGELSNDAGKTGGELDDESLLRRLYIEEDLTRQEIADRFDISRRAVTYWLNKYNIQKGPLTGPDHPSWSGGTFPYGPGWNDAKKEAVRERDGRECVDCGMSEQEHIKETGRKLHVHHIQKARSIDDPEMRNSMENLVSLCESCHLGKWEKMSPLRPDLAVGDD